MVLSRCLINNNFTSVLKLKYYYEWCEGKSREKEKLHKTVSK